MLPFKQLLAAAVLSCGLTRTSACSCTPSSGAICDSVQRAGAVLQVKAVDKLEGANINDDVVYTLETIQVFKAEEPGPNEYDEAGAVFQMITAGNSALCGVFMTTDGTEYLLDMSRTSDGELRAVGICGLFRVWNEEDREVLEAGCDDYDPCTGECTEFQDCLFNYSYDAESYECADVCDPNPCQEGEVCTLEYTDDTSGMFPVAVCDGETTGGSTRAPAPTPAPTGTTRPSASSPPTAAPSPGDRTGPPSGTPSEPSAPPSPTPAPDSAGERPSPPAPTPGAPASRAPMAAPSQAPTAAPSQAPTAAHSDSPTAFPTSSGEDGSRGVPLTPAPSASGGGGGGATPSIPETSSAPTVGGANAEGDTSAAPALRAATTAAFTTAASAVAATAAAAATCASL